MNGRELHLYESETCHGISPAVTVRHGFTETEHDVLHGSGDVHTTQMCMLHDGGHMLADGWRIFVHEPDGCRYELRLGRCDRTDKEIREAHNLYHMWRAGAFGK